MKEVTKKVCMRYGEGVRDSEVGSRSDDEVSHLVSVEIVLKKKCIPQTAETKGT